MSDTFRIVDGIGYIGEKEYRWAKVRSDDTPAFGLPTMHFRGLRFHFESGWVLSVVWGSGTYCENKWTITDHSAVFVEECPNAEIAVWHAPSGGELVFWQESSDTVMGWVTPDQVNGLIQEMMGWTSTPEIPHETTGLRP